MENRLYLGLNNLKEFYLKNKIVILSSIILLFLGITILIALIPNVFAQPVKNVEIISDSVSFEEKDPGAWKVDKSAKWIGKGEAEITFDVDSIMKTNNMNTDVLLVLDISGSMNGDKLNRVKTDSIELIESLLLNDKNKIGLITFDSTSEIISDFTNDKETLINNINNLSTKGATNYYKALVNVDSMLEDYVKEKDTECVVLFLTDGYPNEETPNEEAEYNYLKEQYSFVTINGIQYEMGENILEPIQKVSDNQFIANMDTLNNVLFEASVTPVTYDNFEIADYIDTDYFYVEDSKDIKASQGKVSFDKEEQKVTWTVSGYRSGSDAKMIIKVKLKDELISQDGNFPTNKKEEIKSKIEDTIEDIVSPKTPVLAGKYKVIYDANAPSGCKVSGVIPDEKSYFAFDTVGLSDSVLECDGYQFRGWKMVPKGVVSINDDHFTMPEEDVVIRAVWTKLSLNKSMDGKVKEYIPASLERYTSSSTYGLHKYKSSITDIIFQDSMSSIGGAIEVLDISAEKNNGILAYIVPNADDSTKYTAYIQGDGGIIANSDSSRLFNKFSNLKSIQNLEYLDTSNVTTMASMFENCKSLISLDLRSLDTSSVTNMDSMFSGCSALTSLDLSNLDTSKVTTMYWMFYKCGCLIDLDVSSLNTSNIIDMGSMFSGCSSLTSLDLSSFDTSKVTYMGSMFYNCSSLTNLDLSNFDTSNVTSVSLMFYGCSGLTSLNVSSFDTSKVTDMGFMFNICRSLTGLDLYNFDTSSVTDMHCMFQGCDSLTSLNLINFNTSKVINMDSMFRSCDSLISLDLSSFDTSKVTDMSYMFYHCKGLTGVDLSSFITTSVTTMSNMFSNCSSLRSLDLSSFDTSKVTDMGSMFYDCSSLTNLELNSFDTSNVASMSLMFSSCTNLATTFMIANKLTYYSSMFSNSATAEGAQITVNYTEAVADVIDDYIATKSSSSNVVKGEKAPEYMITVSGNDDIVSDCSKAFAGKTVRLNSILDNIVIKSFKMNGTLINGNKFKMPSENVSITDIVVVEAFVIESEHSPYPNSLNNKIYGEKTFDGATSLTVELDYQTENTSYDWIYLYDSTGKAYGKYGGTTRKTEIITIPGDYIKIAFKTDSSGNNYYGFRAKIFSN